MWKGAAAMTGKNPFCISFGRQPVKYINRAVDKARILNTFTLEPITDQLFLITGVRGTGKTVLMNAISRELESEREWVVLRESPTSDINQAVCSDLLQCTGRKKAFIKQISVAAAGTGVTVERSGTAGNIISQIDELLEKLQKRGKKVLVTIDEVKNSPKMRDFSHMFQIECARGRPLFFLGTGLNENIQSLIDKKDMTFLQRAPKIALAPLNNIAIAGSYENIFGISKEKAVEMAGLVKGYSFAFQALGYVCWEHGMPDDLKAVLPDYDALLSDASYGKIWSECSKNDQKLLAAMAKSRTDDTASIRNLCDGITENSFPVYRARLLKKGIVVSPERGRLQFALPRFREFVLNCILFESYKP